MRKYLLFIGCLFVYLSFIPQLLADDAKSVAGDAESGKVVFRQCVACHFANKNANKIGPSLLGVIGRVAGSLENYHYSPAMVMAGQQGLVWNRENLITFLHNPHSMIKGTRMAAVRLRNDSDIDHLIAYLQMQNKAE